MVVSVLGLTCHTPLMSQTLRMEEPSPGATIFCALAATLRPWDKGCQISDIMEFTVCGKPKISKRNKKVQV